MIPIEAGRCLALMYTRFLRFQSWLMAPRWLHEWLAGQDLCECERAGTSKSCHKRQVGTLMIASGHMAQVFNACVLSVRLTCSIHIYTHIYRYIDIYH